MYFGILLFVEVYKIIDVIQLAGRSLTLVIASRIICDAIKLNEPEINSRCLFAFCFAFVVCFVVCFVFSFLLFFVSLLFHLKHYLCFILEKTPF